MVQNSRCQVSSVISVHPSVQFKNGESDSRVYNKQSEPDIKEVQNTVKKLE